MAGKATVSRVRHYTRGIDKHGFHRSNSDKAMLSKKPSNVENRKRVAGELRSQRKHLGLSGRHFRVKR